MSRIFMESAKSATLIQRHVVANVYSSTNQTFKNNDLSFRRSLKKLGTCALSSQNFIEFFWSAVKQYLREHCDYTFNTLKDNMPKALTPVPLETIRRWEHCMQRWMDAYRCGMETHNAQKHVCTFSSKVYKSH